MLYLHAAVHDHPQAGVSGLLRRLGLLQPQLHPYRLGPHLQGFVTMAGMASTFRKMSTTSTGKGISLRLG